jgi:hypothetical protein
MNNELYVMLILIQNGITLQKAFTKQQAKLQRKEKKLLRRELRNKIHPGIKVSNSTTVNMLLSADMLIIQENEYTLQKSTYELQKLSNNYNFNISTTKTIVMAFQGSTQFDQK